MRFHLPRLVVTRGQHAYTQRELATFMRARTRSELDLEALFERTQVQQRRFELPAGACQPTGCTERINQALIALGTRAVEALFARPDELPPDGSPRVRGWYDTSAASALGVSDCDGLVVVCTSYFGYPGLSRHLQAACGFSTETQTWDLDGAGCGGAPQGLHFAHALLARGDCSTVCLLVIDALGSYSQSRAHDTAPTLAQVTAHSMASDGAVACLLRRGDGPGLSWTDCRARTRAWPDSLHLNCITAEGDGNPHVWVDRDSLERVQQKLDWLLAELPRPLCAHESAGQSAGEAVRLRPGVVLQPGGAALLELARRHSPELAPLLAIAQRELCEQGHVGAPFLLCCLQRALSDEQHVWGPQLRLATTGPGPLAAQVTLEGARFEVARAC
jgi:3-Oxoacyl-[acyl-carrier-protein (ACP)] synthase III